MKVCNVTFNKEKLILDIVHIVSDDMKLTFVISDLSVDCPYFVWEDVHLSQGSSVWIAPLPANLMSVVKNSIDFSGFKCKVYHNNRLVQFDEFPYSNDILLPSTAFLTDEFDIVGHSYLDFFHGDLCNNINFDGVIIDAGANVGFFTLLALQNGAKRVYSIEPDVLPFFYLKRNFLNTNSVILINKAMSDTNGTTKFFYSDGSVASSTIQPTEYNMSTTVETINLQTLLNIENTVNLVKLDIEGNEFKVLAELPDTLFSKINQFFIEFHAVPTEIDKRLRNMGFSVEYRHSSPSDNVGFIYAKNLNL